ncbi:hypothetical protein NDU88_003491 [Pleurodeles waltl]|uniref:Uncharacterized protein n=1 Tax=Pleurodeles waltl TaxID=8319 RepID=A0AAV7Q9T4_PLEWA|nr:hypothetical protein NDU88_003491 [Pleurodeles waltl]
MVGPATSVLTVRARWALLELPAPLGARGQRPSPRGNAGGSSLFPPSLQCPTRLPLVHKARTGLGRAEATCRCCSSSAPPPSSVPPQLGSCCRDSPVSLLNHRSTRNQQTISPVAPPGPQTQADSPRQLRASRALAAARIAKLPWPVRLSPGRSARPPGLRSAPPVTLEALGDGARDRCATV